MLLRHEFVERRKWITAGEFSFTVTLSRMHPGIHLIAQAVLIGYKLRGVRGSLLGLAAMMGPASAITLIFTLFFNALNDSVLGRAVLQGVLPATGGLAFSVAAQMAWERLGPARGAQLGVDLAIVLASFLLSVFMGVQSAALIVGAGILGTFVYRLAGSHGR